MSTLRYLAKRTAVTVFLLWFVLTFLFLMFRLMPGDFADIITMGGGADPETVERFRETWGLNDPLYVQYVRYLANFAQLNAGTSIQTMEPVVEFVGTKIFNTFLLVAPAITFAYVAGVVLGTVAGTNRGGVLEKYFPVPLLFVGAIPEFFLAMVMIIVFAGLLGWFPTSGMVDPATAATFDVWWEVYLSESFLMHYVLPFTTIVLRFLFLPSLIMRTSVVEVLGQDFVFYQRVTGTPKLRRLRTISKHASLPVITMYPISMARAIGGLVLIETVFSWPGMGFALIQAVHARDFPTLQFVFFVIAAFVIVSNYAIDIIYSVIDPRLTVGES